MHVITDTLHSALLISGIKITLLFACGLPIVYMLARMIANHLKHHLNAHSAFLVYKCVYYAGISYIILATLHELGFNITALIGAAGVVGVALGFASQTSMSNIVAGIFLLIEQAFEIGDEIVFDRFSGKIESIDLFSVKMRTSEHTLVRIPNELLIKKELVNVSYFKKRRFLCTLVTPYQSNMQQLIDTVRMTCSMHKNILTAPEIRIDEIIDDRCTLRIYALISNNDIHIIREELLSALTFMLREKGIVVHELYAGTKPSSTDSLRVQITSDQAL